MDSFYTDPDQHESEDDPHDHIEQLREACSRLAFVDGAPVPESMKDVHVWILWIICRRVPSHVRQTA